MKQAFSKEFLIERYFSYFSTKTCAAGTQERCPNETVIFITHIMFLKWVVTKEMTFFRCENMLNCKHDNASVFGKF